VPSVKFSEPDPEHAEKTARLLEREIPKWNIHGSLDTILPALELAKKEQSAVERLRTDPPKIVFRTRPSVLLLYDGKPRVRPVEGTNLKRAENTPFFVVQDAAGAWYLNLGEFWYSAPETRRDVESGCKPSSLGPETAGEGGGQDRGEGGRATGGQEGSPIRQ